MVWRTFRPFLTALLLVALGLAALQGCASPTLPPATPVAPSLVAPTVATAPAPTAPRAPLDPAQTQTFSDSALGISFLYPKDWSLGTRASDAPPGVFIHSPPFPSDPEPIIFAIVVEVHDVPETSVGQFVDDHLAGLSSDEQSGVRRTQSTVGGEAAEQLTGLPSRDGDVETFVLHHGQVFDVILAPYDEGNAQLAPYLPTARAVYQDVLASFAFK